MTVAIQARRWAVALGLLIVGGGGLVVSWLGLSSAGEVTGSTNRVTRHSREHPGALEDPGVLERRPFSATAARPTEEIHQGGNPERAVVEFALPLSPSGDFDLSLTEEQIAALVEAQYGGVFPSLGLPPERLARLRVLLAERQQAAVDAANSALMVGINPIRELGTIRRAIEQAQAPIDAALRGELGDSVFAACREAAGSRRELNSVADLARLLAETGEPLEPEQAKQMLLILRSSPSWDQPMDIDRLIYGGINDRARISDHAAAAAGKVLSPPQMERLRQLQRHWSAVDARRWPNETRSP